jgi:hypothetical protein
MQGLDDRNVPRAIASDPATTGLHDSLAGMLQSSWARVSPWASCEPGARVKPSRSMRGGAKSPWRTAEALPSLSGRGSGCQRGTCLRRGNATWAWWRLVMSEVWASPALIAYKWFTHLVVRFVQAIFNCTLYLGHGITYWEYDISHNLPDF